MRKSTPDKSPSVKKVPDSPTKPGSEVKNQLHVVLARIIHWILFDLPPNIKIMKANSVLIIQKFLTLPVYLFLIYHYQNFSPIAWVTMALHTGYAFAWLCKALVFPNKSFEKQVSMTSLPLNFGYFAIYWYFGFLTISKETSQHPTNQRLFLSISLTILGMMLSFCSDVRLYFASENHEEIIKDTFFKHTRNPNYLGEILVAIAFAELINNNLAWYIISAMICLVFLPRMYQKEYSLKLKKGWEEYRDQTYMLLPKLFIESFFNYVFYVAFFIVVYVVSETGLVKILINLA